MPTATKKVELWFDWEGDVDKARVQFALLTEKDYADIDEKSQVFSHGFNHETKSIEAKFTTNTSEKRRLIATKATKDWSGFFDGDRKPMECTAEHVEFWSCNGDFMAFLQSSQAELQKLAVSQLEEARKNS